MSPKKPTQRPDLRTWPEDLQSELSALSWPEEGEGDSVVPALYTLLRGMEVEAKDAQEFVQILLEFCEENPSEEFGNPGPIVRAIERISGSEALALASLASKPSLVALRLCFRSLGELGCEDVVPLITRLTKSPIPILRDEAASFLSELEPAGFEVDDLDLEELADDIGSDT